MNTNLFRRTSALLAIVFSMAIFSSAFGQEKIMVIATATAKSMLTQGKAGELRNHLVSQLGAKVGNIETAEKRELRANGKTLTTDFVSQLVSYKGENLSQITIKITENGKTEVFDLVQFADGSIGKLVEGKLNKIKDGVSNLVDGTANTSGGGTPIIGSGSSAFSECSGLIKSNCGACRNKITNCLQRDRLYKVYLCLVSNWGDCFACGMSLAGFWSCLVFNW